MEMIVTKVSVAIDATETETVMAAETAIEIGRGEIAAESSSVLTKMLMEMKE